MTVPSEIISLPDTALADVTGFIGTLAVDLWPFIALAVGIPLGFYVIRRGIALVK